MPCRIVPHHREYCNEHMYADTAVVVSRDGITTGYECGGHRTYDQSKFTMLVGWHFCVGARAAFISEGRV